MSEKKSLVEEALLQMKQVEEAISENAKGILASTMKEEINQLVKESLSEQTDDEEEVDTDVDTDTEEEVPVDTDNEDEDDMNMDLSMDVDSESEETPIDLTGIKDDEKLLKVFQAMSEDDGIIVVKDGEDVNLQDKNTNKEYLIRMGESIEYTKKQIMEYADESDLNTVVDKLFSDDDTSEFEDDYSSDTSEFEDDDSSDLFEYEEDDSGFGVDFEDFSSETDDDEVMYEITMDDTASSDEDDFEFYEHSDSSDEPIYEIEMDESMEDEMDESMEDEMDESMEDEMDESMEDEMDESMEDEMDYDSYMMDESYSHKKAKKGIKPKGIGIGSPKFSYKKTSGGFKESMKQGTKGVGMGKAKFEYKEGMNLDGKMKNVKKTETKEAARTLANGKAWGRKGLNKPRTSPRHLKLESVDDEISMLRQKNDEYRKALNTFREKLNEVAVFNSNLAYATRLFTEHSTTKKEKINILRRFDDVETLKESKSLYRVIKDELSETQTKTMNESVEKRINKTVSTGSSTTLIESKTYENPQFLRIKDLMNKL